LKRLRNLLPVTLTYEIKLLFAQFEVYFPACTFVIIKVFRPQTASFHSCDTL